MHSRGLFLAIGLKNGLDFPSLAGHMYYFSITFRFQFLFRGWMTDETFYLSAGWNSELALKILIAAKRGEHNCDSKDMRSLPF